MKMTLFCLASLLSIGFTFGQVADSAYSLTYEDYMQKSKKQKDAGLILTIAGASGLLVTALIQSLHDLGTTLVSLGTRKADNAPYTIPYILSGVAVTSGVILLVASSGNKKKAREILLGMKMETAPVLRQVSVENYAYPSLSLKIKL